MAAQKRRQLSSCQRTEVSRVIRRRCLSAYVFLLCRPRAHSFFSLSSVRSVTNARATAHNRWLEFSGADIIIPVAVSLPAALKEHHIEHLRGVVDVAVGGEEGQEVAVGRQAARAGQCLRLEDMDEGLGEWAGFKCMRLLSVDGMDNHNRLWLDQEVLMHVQLIKDAVSCGQTGGGETGNAQRRYSV